MAWSRGRENERSRSVGHTGPHPESIINESSESSLEAALLARTAGQQDNSLPAAGGGNYVVRARKRKRGIVPRIHPFGTSEREGLLFVGCILALALTYFIAAQRLSIFLAALVLLSSSPPLEQ